MMPKVEYSPSIANSNLVRVNLLDDDGKFLLGLGYLASTKAEAKAVAERWLSEDIQKMHDKVNKYQERIRDLQKQLSLVMQLDD